MINGGMMKRALLTLAVVSLSGPLLAEESAFQYASYEILTDYPTCSSPGHIAYKATFDVKLDDAIYLVGPVPRGCSVTISRGNQREKIQMPCAGEAVEAVDAEEYLSSDAFCPATQELRPATINLRGTLIGCISVVGHTFVGGDWEATTARPKGTTVVSGSYDDPRFEVDYHSTEAGENSFFAPSLNFWLKLEEETVSNLPDTLLQTVGFRQFLPLIDLTSPDCRADPRGCWFDGKEIDTSVSYHLVKETARICGGSDGDPDLGGTFISRDVPSEGEN